MRHHSILLISYWYPNKSNKNFGIFVKRHARAIKENNKVVVLAVTVLKGKSLLKKTTEKTIDENGIETHHIYLESIFNKLLYVLLPLHFSVIKKYVLTQLTPAHTFDFVHSNVIFPCGIIGHRLAEMLKAKHVITEHWTRVDKFFSKSLYASAGKRALNEAYAITCVSETLKQTVQKYTSNNRLFVVPNVIDGSQFYYDHRIQKNARFTFIAVASWMPHKNPFYFLNALQALVNEKKMNDFKMVIVGKGGQIEQMKANNYSFDIDYTGSLSAEEIRVQLNKSHVFLHGSDYETFSVIIAEALLCGLPSVVSPYGIATEVINASNGFVTDNTATDWKNKILTCYQTTYNNALIADQLKGKYDIKPVGELMDRAYN
jgi:glycosyltransferase involved in cell wall biosynthesis